MVLMPTDLPEPVVPAISRCGMRDRSAMIGSPPIFLPSASASRAVGVLEVRRLEQLAQHHDLAPVVGQLDADGVAAGHHGDAGGDRAHRAGDVVGEPDHARRLGAGRGLELVERDHGAGAHIGDLALDAEILQHAFELARILLQHLVADAAAAFERARLLQQLDRRRLVRRRPCAPSEVPVCFFFSLAAVRVMR